MNTAARKTFVVEEAVCPCRLDVFLTDAIRDLSRTRVQGMIRDGEVWVDGAVAKPRHELLGGETVTAVVPLPQSPIPKAEELALDVLYEDEHVLVVNKPPGMTVHPGAGVRSGTLVNALLYHCPDLSAVGGAARPGIVHRLDRLTSGVLCVARTDSAHRALAAQLADRSMSRIYLTWVMGETREISGSIDAPIGRHPHRRTQMSVVRDGRHARTHWWAIARAPGLTRLACRLETGRTHQIRVHLRHLGYPVCGDPEYGFAPKRAKDCIPAGYPKIEQAVAHCERQLLHAWRIAFIHPASGVTMVFEAPPPEDFHAFEEVLAPWTLPTPEAGRFA